MTPRTIFEDHIEAHLIPPWKTVVFSDNIRYIRYMRNEIDKLKRIKTIVEALIKNDEVPYTLTTLNDNDEDIMIIYTVDGNGYPTIKLPKETYNDIQEKIRNKIENIDDENKALEIIRRTELGETMNYIEQQIQLQETFMKKQIEWIKYLVQNNLLKREKQ